MKRIYDVFDIPTGTILIQVYSPRIYDINIKLDNCIMLLEEIGEDGLLNSIDNNRIGFKSTLKFINDNLCARRKLYIADDWIQRLFK
jgi:hypothetical protein